MNFGFRSTVQPHFRAFVMSRRPRTPRTPVPHRPRIAGSKNALYEVEVALVRLQLRRGHFLDGDRVVGGIGNDGVAVPVVVGRREKRVNICKDGFANLDGVRFGRKISKGDLTKIRREDECVLTCSGAVVADDLDRDGVSPDHLRRLARRDLSRDAASAAAVVCKLDYTLRLLSE